MNHSKGITNALISVFYKDGLEQLALALHKLDIAIYSTGGTQDFIEKLGIPVKRVEDLTSYPSILGGRVKTLHPKVFGGILARRENPQDIQETAQYEIPFFDLVVVDLYPFEETIKSTSDESKIIEKIDIGGVSLIRAAAKNFNDVLLVCDKTDYASITNLLTEQKGQTSMEQRRQYASKGFQVTAAYDGLIHHYFNPDTSLQALPAAEQKLRYGENPHQKGSFYGNLDEVLEQLNGKELSYNNLLDIDAALNLISDFDEPTAAIIKHNNPCGVASRSTMLQAWNDALAADPVSAFGGIIALKGKVDAETATEIDKIFFEVLIAPAFDEEALTLLKSKKNRIILRQKQALNEKTSLRSVLNGVAWQEKDLVVLTPENLVLRTNLAASDSQVADLLFADKIVKHTKSNTIVLAKNKQLLGIGCGQTSRVDALKQAIGKAQSFGFSLEGAVMSSDAFFPFPDCVEIAFNEGIRAVIQPGGSIKDDASIEYCNQNGMSMYFSGVRHFKH